MDLGHTKPWQEIAGFGLGLKAGWTNLLQLGKNVGLIKMYYYFKHK